MEELLCDAAMRGDLQLLHEITAKDSLILDKVLLGCFKGKNPLHLAISRGKAQFVEELLKTHKKLAEVVDTELGVALHIASATAEVVDTELGAALHIASATANGDLRIVEALVKASPKMCIALDRNGNNPLHIAAMNGKVDVLKKLVQTINTLVVEEPEVILDRGDTVLQLCADYKQFGSLDPSLKTKIVDEYVYSKDANGNTILHIAVAGKHLQIVEYLLSSQAKGPLLGSSNIDLNAKNGAGCRAMDINFFVNGEAEDPIKKVLLKAGVKRSKMWVTPPAPGVKRLLESIMVVTSLFATMAFQVGVNPPGGVWQDDSKGHRVGEAILASKNQYQYGWFMYLNTIGFFLCLAAILVLLILSVPLPDKPAGWVLPVMAFLTIFTTAYTYTYSVIVISPKHLMAGVPFYSFAAAMAGSLMVIVVVLLVSCRERSGRKKSSSSGQSGSSGPSGDSGEGNASMP